MSSPSMMTTVRLAAAGGRTDRLRMIFTMLGAAAATILLCLAASVIFIAEGDGPYRFDVLNQPGLRPGVIIAMVLLAVPVLVFVGQCSRFGAPARDRRLARLRMAGAGPRDVARIVAVESGLAALLGSVAGVAAVLLAKARFSTEHIATITTETPIRGEGILIENVTTTVRLIPTDAAIPLWAIVVLIAIVPVLAIAFSELALRQVIISPFGVTRSAPTKPPTLLPVVLFGGGTLAFIGWSTVVEVLNLAERALPVVVIVSLVFFLMVSAGLLIGGGSIATAAGRFIAPRTSRPALLIAARRLISAPYTSARATTSVLLAVFIGSAVQGVRAAFVTGTDPDDTFYATTFDLLNVVLFAAIVLSTASLLITTTEAVVERRRTLAALSAAGTPRSTLGWSLLAETLIPLIPSVVLAALAGVLSARGVFGSRVSTWDDAAGVEVLLRVPVPFAAVATLTMGAIVVSLTATAISLVTLGRSLSVSELRTAA